MSYRVMVRSAEGRELRDSTACTEWRAREAWSTWATYETWEDAVNQRQELQTGGVHAIVIDEERYPGFAATHRMA